MNYISEKLLKKDKNPGKGKIIVLRERLVQRRRARQPTPGFLPGESPGQRGLAGYSPWDRKESDMTEQRNVLLVNTITESLAHRAVTSLGLSVLFCEVKR